MLGKTAALAALWAFLFLAPGARCETLSAPQYRLKIHPDAKISERVDTGWEKLMTVEMDGQRARVRWKPGEFTVIFPDATSRSKLSEGSSEQTYELVTDFEGRRYKVNRSPREVGWILPGQEVFFRTFGGRVSNVVGTSDYLKITRDSRVGRLQLESAAGTSDVLLRQGALEVFEGPEITAHVYFVRGLSFVRGPITFEVPLPEEPFLNALPPDRYLQVLSRATLPVPVEAEPAEPPTEPLQDASSPLDAEPATWDSPMLNAVEGDRKEDPMNARREVRHSSKDRPLDAKTAPDSEDLLKVKDY